MLSVTDSRTGRPVEISGARRGLLTVRVRLTCPGGGADAADLRALVVGDVLRRVVESTGRQVLGVVDHPELTAGQATALDRAAAALWVPPLTAAGAWDRADVTVHPDGAAPDAGTSDGTRVAVGAVPGWPPDAGLPGDGQVDAQAVRLALLRHPHGEPAALTHKGLADAADTLARWRRGVSEWSREPSKALPGEIRSAAHTALARDLDTPTVLDLLDHVADSPGIAPGAKFEIFAHLDRFLALELPRDIGS